MNLQLSNSSKDIQKNRSTYQKVWNHEFLFYRPKRQYENLFYRLDGIETYL